MHATFVPLCPYHRASATILRRSRLDSAALFSARQLEPWFRREALAVAHSPAPTAPVKTGRSGTRYRLPSQQLDSRLPADLGSWSGPETGAEPHFVPAGYHGSSSAFAATCGPYPLRDSPPRSSGGPLNWASRSASGGLALNAGLGGGESSWGSPMTGSPSWESELEPSFKTMLSSASPTSSRGAGKAPDLARDRSSPPPTRDLTALFEQASLPHAAAAEEKQRLAAQQRWLDEREQQGLSSGHGLSEQQAHVERGDDQQQQQQLHGGVYKRTQSAGRSRLAVSSSAHQLPPGRADPAAASGGSGLGSAQDLVRVVEEEEDGRMLLSPDDKRLLSVFGGLAHDKSAPMSAGSCASDASPMKAPNVTTEAIAKMRAMYASPYGAGGDTPQASAAEQGRRGPEATFSSPAARRLVFGEDGVDEEPTQRKGSEPPPPHAGPDARKTLLFSPEAAAGDRAAVTAFVTNKEIAGVDKDGFLGRDSTSSLRADGSPLVATHRYRPELQESTRLGDMTWRVRPIDRPLPGTVAILGRVEELRGRILDLHRLLDKMRGESGRLSASLAAARGGVLLPGAERQHNQGFAVAPADPQQQREAHGAGSATYASAEMGGHSRTSSRAVEAASSAPVGGRAKRGGAGLKSRLSATSSGGLPSSEEGEGADSSRGGVHLSGGGFGSFLGSFRDPLIQV